jgi:hypothetical protein
MMFNARYCVGVACSSILLQQQEPVERYQMSDAAYSARTGTVREWKEQQQLNSPKAAAPSPIKKPRAVDDAYQVPPELVQVGDRIRLIDGNHQGVVRFIGRVAQMSGYWVCGHAPLQLSQSNASTDELVGCL